MFEFQLVCHLLSCCSDILNKPMKLMFKNVSNHLGKQTSKRSPVSRCQLNISHIFLEY